jgi:hypothetical protein
MSTPTTLESLTVLSTTTKGSCGCGCGCDDPFVSVAVVLPSATEAALDTLDVEAASDREHEA